MPTPKKLNLLDKLYKVYKLTNGPAASHTDRINFLYREGGYQDKVNRLLADKSDVEKNASAAKKVIEDFHKDIFPHEMKLYFEENPSLDPFKDFSKSFDFLEKERVGQVGVNERRDFRWNLAGEFGRKSWAKNPERPFYDIFLKELDNDYTRQAAERIRKLEADNKEFVKLNRTKYREDKFGNPIGDGTYHAGYTVYDIPGTEVSISPSESSESVYVTYRTPDWRRSTSRFSNHFSNQEYKDPIEIMSELGMVRSEPLIEKKLSGRNVKKREIESYPSSGKTYDELRSMPDDERQKYKDMLIVDDNGVKKNWMFDGSTWNDTVGRRYFVRDEFIPLFKKNFEEQE